MKSFIEYLSDNVAFRKALTDNILPLRWYDVVVVGDILKPIMAWNQSETRSRHLPTEVRVLDVYKTQSQSGVMFTVKTVRGVDVCLDAGWFTPIVNADQ